jgi:Flp pilus assembly protein TadB
MTGGPPVSAGQVLAFVLLAAVLLVGGDPHGRHRLHALHAPPSPPPADIPPVRPAWVAVGAAAACALGWATAGAAAGLLLTAAVACAGIVAVRRSRPDRALAPEPDTELAAGWELLAVCLEAGLPVALAVTAAAEPLRGAVGARLRRTAGLLELGADAAAAWLAA